MNPKLIKYGAMALGALLVLLAAAWFLTEPGRQKRKADEARAENVIAQGQARANRDAVGVVVDSQRRQDAVSKQVEDAANAVRQAPESEQNAVALARLCLLDANYSQPACRELRDARPR